MMRIRERAPILPPNRDSPVVVVPPVPRFYPSADPRLRPARRRIPWEDQLPLRVRVLALKPEGMFYVDSEADIPSTEVSGAICVQKFDDSRNSAIHTTYRISLRSSSLREPRHPLLGVFFLVVCEARD